jgi:glycosyltransferase involved in cell wall biosynthesis
VHSTVLINAGPWLPVPPPGYGGIENVIATLVPELRRRGVAVILCGVEGSTLEVDRLVPTLREPQFRHLAGPYSRMVGIAHAHMLPVLDELRQDRSIDLVHDHLEVVGPSTLGAAEGPPVLHTLHWDLRKHPDFYGAFDGRGRVHFNGVSAAQVVRAPENLQRQVLGAVPLGVPVERLPFESRKGDYLAVLGRLTYDKGPDLAARLCRRLGVPLRLAGPVGGIDGPRALARALGEPGNPAHANDDVRYFKAHVEPLLDGELVRWLGTLLGDEKLQFLARARACVFPGRWHEPGGTAVVEALACGTPVVATRRGAMRTLVEHGVTGFLADNEEELASYLRRVDEIDPAACRAAAEERFSAELMAERYLGLYEAVLERSSASRLALPA